MSDQAYRFDIGRFRCVSLADGTITDAPSGAGPAQVHNVNCLFIDTGEHKVLVDTGCGDGFQSTAGKLLGNLEAAGVDRADIDRIIFTHGHLDHVGGAFEAAGRPVYPNARYLAATKEWECLETRPEKSELQHMFFAGARENCLPIPERFDLLEDGGEALPGIRTIPAPGHTPGLVVLEVSSNSERLLCIGDIIHSEIEFARPDYYAAFDVSPQQAMQTRERILSGAAASGTLVFACHFKFPGLGRIARRDGLFRWEPLEIQNSANRHPGSRLK